MKKKIIFAAVMVALLMLALAVSVSAAKTTTTGETKIVSVTDSNEFNSVVSTVAGISVTDRFVESARVVLANTVTDEETSTSTTYYTTYPTYYILNDNHTQTFSFTALNEALKDRDIYYDAKSIIRIEFPCSKDNENTQIGGGILSGGNQLYVKIPKTTSAINWSAFASSKLEKVDFELDVIDGVEKVRFTSLGDAFYNNKNLTYFEFPNGLVNINNCLSNCSAIEWVTIPASVETVGGCFSSCKSLKWVNFSEKTQLDFNSGVYAMFANCSSLEKLYIPSSVTGFSLGSQRHFEMCTGLKEICIGTNIDGTASFGGFFGQLTFRQCNNLTKIIMPAVESLTVATNAFGEYNANPTIYIIGDLATAEKTIAAFLATDKFAEYETVTYEAGKSDYGACFVVGATYCQLGWHGNNTYTNDCIETCDICEAEVVRLDAEHSYADSILFGEEGYMGYTTKVCACVNCLTPDGEGETLAPLFYNNGFASSNYGTKAIMQSFVINKELLPVYEAVLGSVRYGLVAAVERGLEGTSFGGALYDNDAGDFKAGVAWVDYSDKNYDIFEMIIYNLDGYEDLNVYCCAYVLTGDKVYYLHDGKMAKKATYTSYNAMQ